MSEITQPPASTGFVTLDSIVRSALFDLGESMHSYERFKHFAIDAVREFNFDLSTEVKVVELSLTAYKAIELPLDFIDFVLIGIRIRGEVIVFTNNESIALYFDDEDEDGTPDVQPHGSDDDPINNITDITCTNERYWFLNQNSWGEDKGEMYGLAVKSNGTGYYKLNKQRREIQFNATIPADTKIYLEYISDGYNPNERTVVNIYAAMLIRKYIHWQRHLFSRSSTMADKEMARRDYYVEYDKVKNRVMKITVGDVLDAARDAYRLTPYY